MNTKQLTRIFSMILLCCIILPFVSVTASTEHPYRIYHGIDVSVYQGEIDFHRVADSGIQVVYIRSSAGENYIDPNFESNYRHAKEEDLHVGLYHYMTASSPEEAVRQAHFFYSLIRDHSIDCRPVMDFEALGGLSKESANEIALSFLQTLEQLTGYVPMVYSDASRVRTTWDRSLSRYELWIADYSVEWPNDTGYFHTWAGFQYSDTGRIEGIPDDVDLDHFRSSVLIDSSKKETIHPKERPVYISYTVKRGDTLYRIARRFDLSVQEIVSVNQISDPNRIYIGERLLLPLHLE